MNTEANWAPQACTLPTAEQPLRVAEFSRLFTESLRSLDRDTPTRLRLWLAPSARAEAERLADAESACCSFFSFNIGEAVDGRLCFAIEVPDRYVDVLDAVAEQANAGMRP